MRGTMTAAGKTVLFAKTFRKLVEARPPWRRMLVKMCALLTALALYSSTGTALAQVIPTNKEFNVYTSGSVDIYTLQFKMFSKDISIGSGDFPDKLEFVRENGQYPYQGNIAYATSNFYLTAICSPCDSGSGGSQLTIKAFDGVHSFEGPYVSWGTARTWTNMYADGASVVDNGSALVFTAKNGDQIFFSSTYADGSGIGCGGACRVATHAVTASGAMIIFTYDKISTGTWSQSRLTSVVNSRGYGLQIGYLNPSLTSGDATQRFLMASVTSFRTGCVSGVVDCNSGTFASVSYGWTLVGTNSLGNPLYRMTSFTNAGGRVLNYSYTSSSLGYRLSSAAYADAPSIVLFQNSYVVPAAGTSAASNPELYYEGKISQQTDAVGNVTGYSGGVDTRRPRYHPTTTLTQAESSQIVYSFNANGLNGTLSLPSSAQLPLGKTFTYTYNTYGQLLSETNPEGDRTTYTLDNRGNITQTSKTPKSGATETPLVTSASFPSCTSTNFRICNLPTYTIDARGARTDYSYDTNNGQLLVRLSPADASNARAVTIYYYRSFYPAPGVTAPSGYTLSSASELTSKYDCLGSAVTGNTIDFNYVCSAGQRSRTDYVYTPSTSTGRTNYELEATVRDADSSALRTCYKYDKIGNRIAQTEPRAGLSVCS